MTVKNEWGCSCQILEKLRRSGVRSEKAARHMLLHDLYTTALKETHDYHENDIRVPHLHNFKTKFMVMPSKTSITFKNTEQEATQAFINKH